MKDPAINPNSEADRGDLAQFLGHKRLRQSSPYREDTPHFSSTVSAPSSCTISSAPTSEFGIKGEPTPLDDDPIREHVFDGIQEYDKRLPNWWLWTLHGAIVFSALYWFYYEYPGTLYPDGARVEAEMARIALAAQNSGAELTDEQLWTMSRDASIVAAGKTTYLTTCASCHSDDLAGKIGPNLKDNLWRHGGLPREVLKSVSEGVPQKGMPAWSPVLGRAKTAEVAAFLMSYHSPDSPIEVENVGAAPAP